MHRNSESSEPGDRLGWRVREKESRMTRLTLSDRVNNVGNVCMGCVTLGQEHISWRNR